MRTVGQVSEAISVLRSKIAVYEALVLYLQTHYMPTESGMAEMHVTRSDYGRVPTDHVELSVADLVETLDNMKLELVKLENTPIALPKEPELPATEAKNEPSNRDQDPPAAEPVVAVRDGRPARSRAVPIRDVVPRTAKGEGKP